MAQQAARDPNPFSIDPGDELPVGLQLTWRLRALIATGRLASGERLPSFRRLSEWAGVNVNTVRAVYAGLEQEGLVVSRQGQGTFVAEGIEAAAQLEEIATDALRRAHEAGLSPRELAIVASACASMPGALDDAPAEPPADLPDPAGRARRSRCARSCAARSPGSRPSWPPTRATCRATCRRRRAAPAPTSPGWRSWSRRATR